MSSHFGDTVLINNVPAPDGVAAWLFIKDARFAAASAHAYDAALPALVAGDIGPVYTAQANGSPGAVYFPIVPPGEYFLGAEASGHRSYKGVTVGGTGGGGGGATLPIAEADVADGALLARVGGAETITAAWEHQALVRLRGAGTTTPVLGAYANVGDIVDRLSIRADGRLSWGGGAVAADAFAYRTAAATLRIDDTLQVNRELNANLIGSANVYGAVPMNPWMSVYDNGANKVGQTLTHDNVDGGLGLFGDKVFVGKLGSATRQMNQVQLAFKFDPTNRRLSFSNLPAVGTAPTWDTTLERSAAGRLLTPGEFHAAYLKITSVAGLQFSDGTTMTTAAATSTGLTSTTDMAFAADSDANASGGFTFSIGGVLKLAIPNSGLVGIGIAAPTAALHMGSDAANAASGIKFGVSGDAALYRDAAGSLRTPTVFTAQRLQALAVNLSDIAYRSRIAGDTANRFEITADGFLQWGLGALPADTILYRSAGAAAGGLTLTGTGLTHAILKTTTDPLGGYASETVYQHDGATLTDYYMTAATVHLRGVSSGENVRIGTIGGAPSVGLCGAVPILPYDLVGSAERGSLALATAQLLAALLGVNAHNTDDDPPV